MHDEAELLARQLRETLGDQATVVTADTQELAGLAHATSVVVLCMDRGNHDHARSAADAANEVVELNPTIRLMFGMNGCGEDCREIDQIDDVRATLNTFVSALHAETFWRFELEQQALMLVAIGLGKRQGTQLRVPPWLIKETWSVPKEQ